ncbi:MAG: DUF1080 domain-containing protein [Bacteroidetes bacterium]|nr:hypothetical protein AWN76_004090 [Rhodothermaceae bacterium RA]RMH50240.1 MAG: DUF1080 domain-containing protein [Bacteroidota bacterium]
MLRYGWTGVCLLLLVGCASAPDDGWQVILDPAHTDAWQQVGPGGFDVEGDALRTRGGMGLFWYTRDKLGDVQIRVVYRPERPESNSGVFVRIPERPIEPWMPVMRGYEIQINDAEDDYHATGAIYSMTKVQARPGRSGDWNTMIITLDGPRTTVHVNDVLVTDFTEGDPVPEKRIWWEPDRGRRPLHGYIGLQNHGPEDVVYFREVSIRPLPR